MTAVARSGEARGATQVGQVGEVGRGPLSRGAAWVYRFAVLEVLLVLACLPGLVVALLLDRHPSNLPLAVLALAPVGPALVAGVAASAAWRRDDDLSPARPFVRAYLRDVRATLLWWLPTVLLLAVLTFNLVHLDAVDGGAALLPALLLVTAAVAVWSGHMVVLTASFHLRTRDAARIAVAALVPQWRLSLGVLSLLVVAGAVLVWSEIALLLLAWAFVALLAVMARPLVAHVTERYTRHD